MSSLDVISRRLCCYRLIEKACRRLSKLESEGRESYDAWNQSTVDLVKAAKVGLYDKLDLLECISIMSSLREIFCALSQWCNR